MCGVKERLEFSPAETPLRAGADTWSLWPQNGIWRVDAGLARGWPKLFENILWSDKAIFNFSSFVNRHNCHYWAAHDPEVIVEKMQNPPVTVWCRMTATRVIGPYLLRDTMNAVRYPQTLENYVWPIVSGWENIDELVFMHDDAPSHAMCPYSHLKRYM